MLDLLKTYFKFLLQMFEGNILTFDYEWLLYTRRKFPCSVNIKLGHKITQMIFDWFFDSVI